MDSSKIKLSDPAQIIASVGPSFRFTVIDITAIMATRTASHTQQEWDIIKPDFVELYTQQGKKLKEVSKILEARGFLARQDSSSITFVLLT